MATVKLQSQPFVILDTNVIASWLEKAAKTLWTVDGDDEIADLLNLPAEPAEIADALRGREPKLRVFAPQPAIEKWKSSQDVAMLAQASEDGATAFYLAWDNEKDPKWASWALVRDIFAEQALADAV